MAVVVPSRASLSAWRVPKVGCACMKPSLSFTLDVLGREAVEDRGMGNASQVGEGFADMKTVGPELVRCAPKWLVAPPERAETLERVELSLRLEPVRSDLSGDMRPWMVARFGEIRPLLCTIDSATGQSLIQPVRETRVGTRRRYLSSKALPIGSGSLNGSKLDTSTKASMVSTFVLRLVASSSPSAIGWMPPEP